MKKTCTLLCFLFLSTLSSAQYKEGVGWVSKFGLAGGFTPMWVFTNVDAINEMLPEFGADQLSTGGMLTLGGAGYAYIMLVDNIRIGGMGYSGSMNSSATVDGFRKEADYSIGGGALSIEYTLPSIRRIAVSFGVMLGGGSLELNLHKNRGGFNWQDIWQEISDSESSSENFSRRMKNSFYLVSPTVNIDFPFNRFIALRLGAGYQFTFGGDWEIENEQKLTAVPSDLNGDAFFIQSGIFIGFFAF
jgi:hypothetical protein